MTLEAFYAKIGGNSADVLRRLPSEAMVRKFIGKYPADTSWGSLESAINSQDWEAAFRAAHTLKGVAQNLGFQKLYLLQRGPHRGPARPQAPDRPRPARGRGSGPGRPAESHPGTGRLMPLHRKNLKKSSVFFRSFLTNLAWFATIVRYLRGRFFQLTSFGVWRII